MPLLTLDTVHRISALEAENARLRLRCAELERLAHTDPMVPLANRRVLIRALAVALAQAQRHGTHAALLFVDIDGLKAINDAHGHATGDAAIGHVAALLQAQLRSADLVARIGGDEFGVLLDRVDAAAAHDKAEALRAAILAQPLRFGSLNLVVSITIGMAVIGEQDGVAALLARADADMYAARAQRSER